MGMIDNPITTLVGEELENGDDKWKGSLAAPNGSLYGCPCKARRVVKFDPVSKSITEIGPDFGGGMGSKWKQGAMTDNGVIYCPPCDDRGILTIDTNTDTATELDANLLPEQGNGMWLSRAAALDGCIYCMPYNRARRIMKIDPSNNNAMSSVGDDLGDDYCKYWGTVVGIDGCVYGMYQLCLHFITKLMSTSGVCVNLVTLFTSGWPSFNPTISNLRRMEDKVQ